MGEQSSHCSQPKASGVISEHSLLGFHRVQPLSVIEVRPLRHCDPWGPQSAAEGVLLPCCIPALLRGVNPGAPAGESVFDVRLHHRKRIRHDDEAHEFGVRCADPAADAHPNGSTAADHGVYSTARAARPAPARLRPGAPAFIGARDRMDALATICGTAGPAVNQLRSQEAAMSIFHPVSLAARRAF